jgi:hypothetical protein
MSTLPESRWRARLIGGAIVGATASFVVWSMERLLSIPDPNFVRPILAAIIGGIVGILSRMLVDEIAQQ